MAGGLDFALAEGIPVVALGLPLGDLGGLETLDRGESPLDTGNHLVRPEHLAVVAPMRGVAVAVVVPIGGLGDLIGESRENIPARLGGETAEVGGGGEDGLDLGLVGLGGGGAGEQLTPESPEGGGGGDGGVGGEGGGGDVFHTPSP